MILIVSLGISPDKSDPRRSRSARCPRTRPSRFPLDSPSSGWPWRPTLRARHAPAGGMTSCRSRPGPAGWGGGQAGDDQGRSRPVGRGPGRRKRKVAQVGNVPQGENTKRGRRGNSQKCLEQKWVRGCLCKRRERTGRRRGRGSRITQKCLERKWVKRHR